MALTTVSEASAVNTVIEYLAGIQHNGMGVPEVEEFRSSLRVLVAVAYKKLSAGVIPEQFDDEVWPKIEARLAAVLAGEDGAATR